MQTNERNDLAVQFGNIASAAGKIIMTIRASEVGVVSKADGSPVTDADIKAEELVLERLAIILPGLPIVAEESFKSILGKPLPECFLLVDPLDGTRELLAGESDFTVNIALIDKGGPIVAAICAPALNQVYLAGATAHRAEVRPGAALPPIEMLTAIGVGHRHGPGLRAVVSRSHMDSGTEQWLGELPVAELRPIGSSLKFCLIAQGEADVYPRLSPTMEWDTAAGHAILNAAGGRVVSPDGSPLRYGKIDVGFKNNGFVAWGREPSE